jgi:plasmid stabilization system protein ParE
MNFTLIWLQSATDQLARIVTDLMAAGADANAVTRAVSAVDAALQRTPTTAGESRDGVVRILFERPVVVDFEVHADERVVVVFSVRLYRRD